LLNQKERRRNLKAVRAAMKRSSDYQYQRYVERAHTRAMKVAIEEKMKNKKTPRLELSDLLDEKEVLSQNASTLPNGVTVYHQTPEELTAYQQLVERYDIWALSDRSNVGVVNLPEERWMPIPMKDGWQRRLPKPRVYRVSPADRKVIDETLDLLVQQGKLEKCVGHTPTGFPVFVVWRTVTDKDGNEKQKGRVVVDLRAANKEAEPDAYPIPLQTDIVNLVRGRVYISVIDAAKFFYQWPVKRSHQNHLAIVSHRGQEMFRVTIMGFINSVPYLQRQMDLALEEFQKFAKAYINNIVTVSEMFDKHLEHLSLVFTRLEEMNVKLEPLKAFLGFPSVQLLGQRVDALGLTTPAEKIEAILALKFPATLRQLEHYIGLTSWFRHHIERYAERIDPLQQRKTALLKNAP
jgi:hypothetical protein